MRILITGICGFTGSCLAASLRENRAGLEVFGIDNFVRRGSEQNRSKLSALGVNVVHGDIRHAKDMDALPAADWVIDAAAYPSVLAGVDGKSSSRELMENNLWGAIEVLEYCKRHRAGLLLLSSSRVYSIAALAALPLKSANDAFTLDGSSNLAGGVSPAGIGVDFSTEPPLSLYGASKRASEIAALEYGAAFGFPVWIDRCGVLAGAGQFGTAEQGIFSYWINAHLRRRPLRYIGFEGSGFQSRDALHPNDLSALLLHQIDCARTAGARTYTVGGGPANGMSLKQLTAWCDARFGPHEVARDPRPRPYDVPWVAMDSRAAEADFGWRREKPLASILEEIARHAEQNPRWLEISGVA